MDKLLPWILFWLMAVPTLQDNGQCSETTVLIPKTHKGRVYKPNCTSEPPSLLLPPWLNVRPEEPGGAYTTGLLSTRLIPSAYALAMAVGLPSNVFILWFLRARKRSFSMTVLYLSLALSDMLLLLSLALSIHYHIKGNNWVFGEAACRLVTACFYGNVYCSAHTLACVSLQRYLAVARPFLYRRLPKRTWALGFCAGVWAVFGAAVIPELLVRQSYQLSSLGVTTCHDVLPLDEDTHALLVPYRLALVCLGFILPFLVCVGAQAAVLYHLGRSGRDWAPFVRVSSLVFFIFVVCFAPSGVLHMAHYARLLSDGKDDLYGYYRAAVCLCCFHSCLDPFLCVLMCKTAPAKRHHASPRRKPQRQPALL
ncbi:proteinase-activated receptor 3 [Aplochiton taeniatus]